MSRLEEMDKPGGKKRRLGSEGDLESGSINLRKVLNGTLNSMGANQRAKARNGVYSRSSING